MNNNINAFNNVLQQEINWHNDANNQIKSNVMPEQARWFVKGLEHAKSLLNQYNINDNINTKIISILLRNTCIDEVKELYRIGDEYPISLELKNKYNLNDNDKLIIIKYFQYLRNNHNETGLDLLIQRRSD